MCSVADYMLWCSVVCSIVDYMLLRLFSNGRLHVVCSAMLHCHAVKSVVCSAMVH